MEYVVTKLSALETPHALIEPSTGKVFNMVSLLLEVIQPSGQKEELTLHFAPTHLQDLLPKLQGTIQLALLQTKSQTDGH